MIRRPDERCFSAWRYARERGLDERNFAEAIKAELTGDIYPIESYAGMQMNYIDHSRYHDQLKKLTEYFDNENILIVPFERLRDNSEGVMSIVCEFLRIRDDVAWNFQIANQTVGGNRSKILSNFLYRERNSLVFAVLRLFTSPAFRATVRSKMINWNRSSSVVENVKPDDDIMATIRAILTPDVKLYDQAKDRFDQLLRDRRVVPEE